ncbi:Cytochrome P450 monooxygenase [Rhizoctonia solani]|uniref:Cytochrome P450 monooxygenase n=1 Tax=Rhizoctonia solani TaxID=456999 RepID=A0A8H7IHA5_9AGAM|nr:Cytochrome P450 monooxygenase [Rhizoctonia solani]
MSGILFVVSAAYLFPQQVQAKNVSLCDIKDVLPLRRGQHSPDNMHDSNCILHYSAAAGAFLISFYVIPYLLDPYDYRRRFPGPWSAVLSNSWKSSAVKTGKACNTMFEIHQKYGPFVRIGPNHISIADPDALEDIYKHGNGLLKSDYYAMFRLGTHESLFTSRDKAEHSTKRRRLAHIFSPQNILSYQPRVRNNIRHLVDQLDMRCQQAAEGRSGFNWSAKDGVLYWISAHVKMSYLAFDLIGDLAMRSPLGMIQAQRDTTNVAKSLTDGAKTIQLPLIELFDKGTQSVSSIGVYPRWAQASLLLLPWNLYGLLRTQDSSDDKEARGVDMADKLLEARDEDGNLNSREELLIETFGLLFAGSDTTSNTLSAFCFYLAKHPHLQAKLQAELDEHIPLKYSHQDTESGSEIDRWPRDDEAALGPRTRTAESGTARQELHSRWTNVQSRQHHQCTYVRYKRESVWGHDADEFRPERWLEDSKDVVRVDQLNLMYAHKACMGRNLAIMDILLIVATIFRRYDLQLGHPDAKPTIRDSVIRQVYDCPIAIKRRGMATE